MKMNKILQWLTLLMLLCCLQPAFATPTTPSSDFEAYNDGTVKHKPTGLIFGCAVQWGKRGIKRPQIVLALPHCTLGMRQWH
jgi:hypothetical protein